MTDSLPLNSSLQNLANNGYSKAISRCSILVASALGLDAVFSKTSFGIKLWPQYSSFKLDNKFYALAVLTTMCAQYSIKSTGIYGVVERNHEIFQQDLDEEYKQIEQRETQKKLKQQQTLTLLPEQLPVPNNLSQSSLNPNSV